MSDDAMLRMLAKLIAPYVAKELAATGTATHAVYTQYDDERAPGCSGSRHLRIWRKARAAGDPGATSDGRARLLTRETYERFAPQETTKRTPPKRTKTTVDVPCIDDEARALLGVSLTGTNGRLPPMISGCRMSDPEPEGSAA